MKSQVARLPNFLVVGAQKCGTTWLHHHLRQHPRVFMPEGKDQGHFCWTRGPHATTPVEYAATFKNARADQCIGEATAAYFWTETGSAWERKPDGYQENIPQRVRAELGPDLRLILSLRDPVERAVSGYFHHIAFGSARPEIPLMETDLELGIVDIGFYGKHLENWLGAYPGSSVHIIDLQEDIAQNPDRTLGAAFEFLGIDSDVVGSDTAHKIFSGSVRSSEFGEVCGSNGVSVSATTLETLRNAYRDDVYRLSELSGRDFMAAWNYD